MTIGNVGGIKSGIMGLLAVATLAAPDGRAAETDAATLARGVGQRVANFTLKNLEGKPVTLYGFRGKKAVVLVFLGADCPVGNLYAPRLVELSEAYRDKGVVFLGINANARETVEQAAEHAREHGINFTVLKDQNNLIADLTLAERTCEALVLDGVAILRYRGAIDDQYVQGAGKEKPTKNFLRDALDAVLANQPVAVPSTPVAGCLIDRVEPKPALANGPKVRKPSAEFVAVWDAAEAAQEKQRAPIGKVTYAADVAAIVQNKCQSCHRPGEAAPFALTTYDDARRHAAMISEVVDDRRMPPWHADPHSGPFANNRGLTGHERATLLAWVEQGAPLGDPAVLPPPKTFPEGWGIGTPDVVFEIPEPYEVAAQGTLDYVYMKVPTNFKEDRWVQAAEARPGDRGVVHHIIVYVDDHKGSRRETGHLCGYAPGDMPSVYPPGTAKKIAAGSDLIFQVHYTPNGKRHTDRSKVGLIFAKEPVQHEAHTLGIVNHRFVIPPGSDNYPVSSSFTFSKDAHLLSFMPHMHLHGKSFAYKATYPDGKTEDLLSVPAFDFGWQSFYIYTEPKAMPKGTKIDCLAHFDNSSNNPYNPDPAKAVAWGDQTFQEMMIGYIDYVDDAPIAAATH